MPVGSIALLLLGAHTGANMTSLPLTRDTGVTIRPTHARHRSHTGPTDVTDIGGDNYVYKEVHVYIFNRYTDVRGISQSPTMDKPASLTTHAARIDAAATNPARIFQYTYQHS